MSNEKNLLFTQNTNCKKSLILSKVINETQNGKSIPSIFKNKVPVHKLLIFEDIVLRNKDNLDVTAIEINNQSMTYMDFFVEVEKYIRAFDYIGVKESDIVTLCLPVSVEFICAYFALTTLGATCNATNIMFMIQDGVETYTKKRCSKIMMCDLQYIELMCQSGSLNDRDLEKIILTDGSEYSKSFDKTNCITSLNKLLNYTEIITMKRFLSLYKKNQRVKIAKYNDERASTFTYTSGTTGVSKCIAHSDLAPLFLIASHDLIKRQDESVGDRTLVTIPFQHPTGLFYAMVLQLACGKTLVLEPHYDKTIFYSDIKNLRINHAVQAKPFYAQLIEDRKSGRLKKDDFKLFKHPYSGGEGIPKAVCQEINDTLHFAGCPNDILMGYGRSEEGSSTIIAYNISSRLNTAGKPIPGVLVRLVDPITKHVVPQKIGSVGEIQICTPVMPLGNHYLGEYNTQDISDNSILDDDGNRWVQPMDIATIVECGNNEWSYLILGRNDDFIEKNGKNVYLFELKEMVSDISGVQECEIIVIHSGNHKYVTVHCVINKEKRFDTESIIRDICNSSEYIDGVKMYDSFGINATSGKCDKEAMRQCKMGYYIYHEGSIQHINF